MSDRPTTITAREYLENLTKYSDDICIVTYKDYDVWGAWSNGDDGKVFLKLGNAIALSVDSDTKLDVRWPTPAQPELPPLPDQYRFNKLSWYYEHYDAHTNKWQRIIELDENFSIVIFEKLWFAHEITTLQAILAHAAKLAEQAEV